MIFTALSMIKCPLVLKVDGRLMIDSYVEGISGGSEV